MGLGSDVCASGVCNDCLNLLKEIHLRAGVCEGEKFVWV